METTKKTNGNLPTMTRIREMEVGEMIVLPFETVANIRANLSVYGKMYNKKYKAHLNRQTQKMEVTRVE